MKGPVGGCGLVTACQPVTYLLDGTVRRPCDRVNRGIRTFATDDHRRYSPRSRGAEQRLGPMFGRDAERAQIERMLDSAPDKPTGLALEGAPGIGKTTLWREAVQSARERGYRVLTAAPGEPDAALAFAGLADLFDGPAAEFAADLPGPQRQALAAALSLEAAPDVPAESTALPRAILTMVRRLAVTGPVVLAVDDEQWLDPPSARVLAFALCRLREEPVFVLLTRRVESDGALWPELARASVRTASRPSPSRRWIWKRLTRCSERSSAARSRGRCFAASTRPRAVTRCSLWRSRASSTRPERGLTIFGSPGRCRRRLQQRLRSTDDRAYDPMLAIAAVSQPNLRHAAGGPS